MSEASLGHRPAPCLGTEPRGLDMRGTHNKTHKDGRISEGWWLTTRQAANLARLSERKVRKLCTLGRIYAMRRGSHWLIPGDRFVATLMVPSNCARDCAQLSV